ncbi:MAG: hypothetical protein QF890_17245 [Myxococcota bacterium]|jgi:hypothetical protein|nr:hypothetical protein [Deltaproteobacteria bacterium]MCP4240705.1 hypothetical protein [bacterium]MDP6243158.1 hypothetical protein [Myxococcota bacterium]MDP7073096.1 hypothetical protein [Myxococcota bacterium]MDP7299194.1 hypothetical protein [Myxococcota bacterium]
MKFGVRHLFESPMGRSTRRIRRGTGVVVLPRHHPVRVAEEVAPCVNWYLRTYSKRVAPHVGEPAIEGCENCTLLRDVTQMLEGEQFLAVGAVICGEADYVTERVAEIRDKIGVATLLCWTRMGGLPTERALAHMETMRDRVMPALH